MVYLEGSPKAENRTEFCLILILNIVYPSLNTSTLRSLLTLTLSLIEPPQLGAGGRIGANSPNIIQARD